MTVPRSILIDPGMTRYYHCISRCVRRAYLCGEDPLTGYNFEHRRAWIERRIHKLAKIFAIDLCAYAVMSNHYHVVLHLSREGLHWTEKEVIERWGRIHRVPEWVEAADAASVSEIVDVWRRRLGSISWFMKCINEPLARLANQEDGCSGRFWEGRFRSQALLDEAAVLRCMAYVDLNPVRAGTANTPEESDHTSIQSRIERREGALAPLKNVDAVEFSLPISRREYLLLVDWTGRQLRSGKKGRIQPELPSIVDRLAKSCRFEWLQEMTHLSRRYGRAIGTASSLELFRDRLGVSRLKGLSTA